MVFGDSISCGESEILECLLAPSSKIEEVQVQVSRDNRYFPQFVDRHIHASSIFVPLCPELEMDRLEPLLATGTR
eukprot:scaffold318267_cov27-Tisochrysis_lutea.AAC.4